MAKKNWDNRIRLAKKWDNRIRLAKKYMDWDKRIRLAKKSDWGNQIRLVKKPGLRGPWSLVNRHVNDEPSTDDFEEADNEPGYEKRANYIRLL